MQPVIFFRKDWDTEKEFEIAQQYFPVYEYRTEIPKGSLVIGRYSVLPYYKYLERDLLNLGSQLINSRPQHAWIADFDYYEELKEYTPESWRDHNFYQCNHPGPFVVKGSTNSRKHLWKKSMFAENKRHALEIASELANDSLIGPQGLIYRKFIPLKTFEIDPISGLPYSNEFRFFFLGETLLTYAYYWSCAEHPELGTMTDTGVAFARKVASIASKFVNFFVLDIAETADGQWILIEINDAQMSGFR